MIGAGYCRERKFAICVSMEDQSLKADTIFLFSAVIYLVLWV